MKAAFPFTSLHFLLGCYFGSFQPAPPTYRLQLELSNRQMQREYQTNQHDFIESEIDFTVSQWPVHLVDSLAVVSVSQTMTTVSLDDGSNLHYIISAFPYTLLYAEFGYDLVCKFGLQQNQKHFI